MRLAGCWLLLLGAVSLRWTTIKGERAAGGGGEWREGEEGRQERWRMKRETGREQGEGDHTNACMLLLVNMK